MPGGGLQINENQQVIDADARPIDGLWAAGNCSGSFFFGDYPITISGASHGRACAGGRRAGQFAADRALGALHPHGYICLEGAVSGRFALRTSSAR